MINAISKGRSQACSSLHLVIEGLLNCCVPDEYQIAKFEVVVIDGILVLTFKDDHSLDSCCIDLALEFQ